jgi:uncharacterized protein
MTERQIKCPQCGLLTVYKQENSFRPFCSERCKLIDLGQWASEDYKIPTNEVAQIFQDSAQNQNDSDESEV